MSPDDLDRWFAANQSLLETAYLTGLRPWQQSGFGLHTPHTAEEWTAHRRPIADAIDRSGAFLDIGCANGYLLECVLAWTSERGLTLDPYGLDFAPRLVALARERLPTFASHLFVGNAWEWQPPRTFDLVRTELVYVPQPLHRAFIARLLDRYLAPGGQLLLAEYRARGGASAPPLTIDQTANALGFSVARVTSGWWEGIERTRVAVIPRP